MNKRPNRLSKNSIILLFLNDNSLKSKGKCLLLLQTKNLFESKFKISEAQCPNDWEFVGGKCYRVIVEYHFRFNFVL